MSPLAVVLFVLAAIPATASFVTYKRDDKVSFRLDANVHSRKSFVSVEFDHYIYPHCSNATFVPSSSSSSSLWHKSSLKHTLGGPTYHDSPYQIRFLQEIECQTVCEMSLDEFVTQRWDEVIHGRYFQTFALDGLPSSVVPLGYIDQENQGTFIYNHFNFIVRYASTAKEEETDDQDGAFRILSYQIEPQSIQQTDNRSCHRQNNSASAGQTLMPSKTISLTYNVQWEEDSPSSPAAVSHDEKHVPSATHWRFIRDSSIQVLALGIWVIVVLVCALKRKTYEAIQCTDDEEKDIGNHDDNKDEADKLEVATASSEKTVGWKALDASDVFAPPENHPLLYCVIVGTGAHLFCTAVLACLWCWSNSNSSAVMTTFLCYLLCGPVGGIVSSRMYRVIFSEDGHWAACVFLTAALFPAATAMVFFLMNTIYISTIDSDSSFIPLVLIMAKLGLVWSLVYVPLVFLGAKVGGEPDLVLPKSAPSCTLREVPTSCLARTQSWLGPTLTGLLVYNTICYEMNSMLTAMWMQGEEYSSFPCLLVALLLLATMSVVSTLLLVFYRLRIENHRWWWFGLPMTPGVWMMLHWTFFYLTSLDVAPGMIYSAVLYFFSAGLASVALGCMSGSIGAFTSFWLVAKMYGDGPGDDN